MHRSSAFVAYYLVSHLLHREYEQLLDPQADMKIEAEEFSHCHWYQMGYLGQLHLK